MQETKMMCINNIYMYKDVRCSIWQSISREMKERNRDTEKVKQ